MLLRADAFLEVLFAFRPGGRGGGGEDWCSAWVLGGSDDDGVKTVESGRAKGTRFTFSLCRSPHWFWQK